DLVPHLRHHHGFLALLVLATDDERRAAPFLHLLLGDHDLLLALLGPPELDEDLLLDFLEALLLDLPADGARDRAQLGPGFGAVADDGSGLDRERQEMAGLEAGLPGPRGGSEGDAEGDGGAGQEGYLHGDRSRGCASLGRTPTGSASMEKGGTPG